MTILGIETSCDETSLALFNALSPESGKIISSVISSQVNLHAQFGGVVPEIASRNHLIKLKPMLEEILNRSKTSINNVSLIGVTNTPGLIGALFTGVAFAKALAFALKKPVIGINHLIGHTLAAELENPTLEAPYFSLIISGGHTHLFKVDRAYNFHLIAKTLDDAAGEAFDKVAKILNLGYPGGPLIEKLAQSGRENAIEMPVAMKDSVNFSFSGLKTFVRNIVEHGNASKADIAASFQYTVAKTIYHKLSIANKKFNIKKLVIAGGVASNTYMRNFLSTHLKNIELFIPTPTLCTDNADMIAYAAYKMYNKRKFMALSDSACDKLTRII